MTKNNVDISIIIPIYNAEKYLSRCLDSLVNQTKKELEFILINDGSSDNSEKIVKRYHRRYRSKKIPNNNENHNSENINANHKVINKYRKKHSYH